MCLLYNPVSSVSMLADIHAGKVFFSKRYSVNREGLLVQLHRRAVEIPDKAGFIVSNRKDINPTKEESENRRIDFGIHVLVGKKPIVGEIRGTEIHIPVEVLFNDFIGCNESRDEAVFFKIRVDEEKIRPLMQQIKEDILRDEESDEDEDEEEEEEEECPDCGEPGCCGECLDDEEDFDDEDDDDEDDDDYFDDEEEDEEDEDDDE